MKIRMTENEKKMFISYLKKSRQYLEFGSGGSTELAAIENVSHILSIESDKDWINLLSKNDHVADAIRKNRLNFEFVDLGPVGKWGIPKDDSKIRNWPKYFLTPFTKYERNFDFILVDGRFRLECAFASYPFITPSCAVAIHDYRDRPRLYEVEKFFEIIDNTDSLYIFRKKENINLKSLYVSIFSNIFNYQ